MATAIRLVLLGLLLLPLARGADVRPNVLMISVDDLNVWTGFLGGYPQKITPNIDRLAARGMAFTRAYCASPVCNPSRTATLTGLRPGSTGVYNNLIDWRKHIPAERTLPATFKRAGYRTIGSGNIFHNLFNEVPGIWDEWLPFDGNNPKPPAHVSHGVGGIVFAPVGAPEDEMRDHRMITWLSERLHRNTSTPFFMACGIYKPHLPWNVPRKYFEMFPLEKIVRPEVLDRDWDDLPAAGRFCARNFASHGGAVERSDHEIMLESGRWKEAVQAYLASIAFADAQVGRMLDALDRSPHRDSTIVVLWSDHGFHVGEKLHWRKMTLWEEAGRIPLVWVVPGLTRPGQLCARTVDLMSLYPTLAELCGIPIPSHVEGIGIRSLLANPQASWNRPAITTARLNDHSVRSEQWRYIRYHDGGEELYDETKDPREWTNLARDSRHAAVKADLARWLPKTNRPVLPPDMQEK